MRSRRILSLLIAGLVAGALLVASAASAQAAEAPTSGGTRSIAVSIPPDAVVFEPGHDSAVQVRVSNPGTTDVTVSFEQRGLEFGDNGAVKMLSGPDAEWVTHVHLPEGEHLIPAQGYRDFTVSVSMPTDLGPDTYLIGFVVTPKPADAGSVQVINQIGSYFKVDIPGPRDWKLAAKTKLPSFVLGGTADGTVEVQNLGKSSIDFWGDVTTKTWPFGGIKQQQIKKLFLPRGHKRSVVVKASPPWGIGIVTVPVRISYPTNAGGSADILMSKRVLVVHPLWIVAFCVLVLVIAYLLFRRWRRRRAERVGPKKPPKKPKTPKSPKDTKAPKIKKTPVPLSKIRDLESELAGERKRDLLPKP